MPAVLYWCFSSPFFFDWTTLYIEMELFFLSLETHPLRIPGLNLWDHASLTSQSLSICLSAMLFAWGTFMHPIQRGSTRDSFSLLLNPAISDYRFLRQQISNWKFRKRYSFLSGRILLACVWLASWWGWLVFSTRSSQGSHSLMGGEQLIIKAIACPAL